ncbi:hypothetical protein U1872_18250 [Sphingomonas sp. RB3P16]|uniref:hypothetical protein n=1 Tax=Parasphingomonas frigoris TaxID=3096163 RepID=UPI002FC8CBBC
MANPTAFTDHREAARAILRAVLNGTGTLRPKEGQFLGGLSFDANTLTTKQLDWLLGLLERHGLPTFDWEDAQ